jgi:hypothetical protein
MQGRQAGIRTSHLGLVSKDTCHEALKLGTRLLLGGVRPSHLERLSWPSIAIHSLGTLILLCPLPAPFVNTRCWGSMRVCTRTQAQAQAQGPRSANAQRAKSQGQNPPLLAHRVSRPYLAGDESLLMDRCRSWIRLVRGTAAGEIIGTGGGEARGGFAWEVCWNPLCYCSPPSRVGSIRLDVRDHRRSLQDHAYLRLPARLFCHSTLRTCGPTL